MEFYKKYTHVGTSYPSVPDPWKPIVEEAIKKIEKKMWPRWMPMFIKRWIFKLATGNSIVRIRSKFWFKIYKHLTKSSVITQIKDKFAVLCIYMMGYDDEYDEIIEDATYECTHICERCGTYRMTLGIPVSDVRGWYRRLCPGCKMEESLEVSKEELCCYD